MPADIEDALSVNALSVDYSLRRSGIELRRRKLRAVDNVELAVAPGETLGLVGESGSGKSTAGLAIVGLVRPAGGIVKVGGTEVSTSGRAVPKSMRKDLQMVFQDPYSSLDPSMTVGDAVAEPLDVHERLSRIERRARVSEVMHRVGLRESHIERYPHEFSGGQRQRIAIARAIILRPKVVVCDEPVSALDVSTQSQIINLLFELQEEFGMSYLFIAHDLPLVKIVSSQMAVMYLSQVVETGPSERVYERPAHPYSAALISAVPHVSAKEREARPRIVLDSDPPNALEPPAGCRFHTRCPLVMDVCRTEAPAVTPVNGGGTVACHLHTTGPKLAGEPVLALLEKEKST